MLVHGVFADASGWNDVIARLHEAGFPVIAPANPLRDLAEDSAYVAQRRRHHPRPGHPRRALLRRRGHHQRRRGGRANVKALVYVAAFAPDEGENALGLAESSRAASCRVRCWPARTRVRGTPTGTDGYIDPAKFHDVFAQTCRRR